VIRIGQGIDIHPFDPARPLILGGIRVADTGGLSGHSDADAVLHAITDALLGADSSVFVREAKRILDEMRAEISNVDVTIIAQQPKLAPFREAMAASIARLLDLPQGHVNVKATTTDHLGFIGRAEGICAMAVLLAEVRP
jgi:2C-methyl-D-erythritol 2,4-cyclodiphosphate synthase